MLKLYGNDDSKSTFEEKELKHLNPLDTYEKKEKIIIRKSDLDFNGHVNNVKYFDYSNYISKKDYSVRKLMLWDLEFTRNFNSTCNVIYEKKDNL